MNWTFTNILRGGNVDIVASSNNRVNIFLPLCWEDAITTYFNMIGIHCYNIFVDSWNFYYVDNSSILGENIMTTFNINKNLLDYLNVNLQIKNITNIEQLINILNMNLKNDRPTIIHADTYYNYWGYLYKKVHTPHLNLVCKHDKEIRIIYTIDPGFSNKMLPFTYDLLELSCEFYLEIDDHNIKQISSTELLHKLLERNELINKTMFLEIQKFAYNFYHKFDPQKEFKNCNDFDEVMNSKLIESIRYVIKGRNLFIVFLENMKEIKIDFDEVINLMLLSISKWNLIINLLLKSTKAGWGNDFNNKIQKIINSIPQIEMSAYDLLYKKVLGNEIKEANCKLFSLYNNQFIYLDLKNYFNNKGFTSDINSKNCDLTQAGEYFIIDSIDTPYYLNQKNISFRIDLNNDVDNIICESQEIEIDASLCCKGIGVLCCSEWGRNYETISIIDELDNLFNIPIKANDLSESKDVNSVVIGKTYSLSENKFIQEQASVTYNIKYFEKIKHIKKILLPVCPNMHIISITLIV